jgi:alpha-amylase
MRLRIRYLEKNPNQVLDSNPFTIAEVYNYNISAGKYFDFGDKRQTTTKWF